MPQIAAGAIDGELAEQGGGEILRGPRLDRRMAEQGDERFAVRAGRHRGYCRSSAAARGPAPTARPKCRPPPAGCASTGTIGAKRATCSTPFCSTATRVSGADQPLEPGRRARRRHRPWCRPTPSRPAWHRRDRSAPRAGDVIVPPGASISSRSTGVRAHRVSARSSGTAPATPPPSRRSRLARSMRSSSCPQLPVQCAAAAQ